MFRKIYTREIELEQKDENTVEALEVRLAHYDSMYKVVVTKLEKSNKFGYNSVSFMLFGEGNFQFTIKDGRFSKKQATILSNKLSTIDMDTVKMLWSNKSYEPLVHYIKDTLLLENK